MAGKTTSVAVEFKAKMGPYMSGLRKGSEKTKEFGSSVKNGFGEAKGGVQSLVSVIQGDFTALPSVFKSAGTSAKGFSTSLKGIKLALISTGIGAIVVALGLAVAALTEYFTSTRDGEIAFKKVMNGINAVIGPIKHSIGELGKAVYLMMTGDFKKAWKVASESFDKTKGQITANLDDLKTQVDEFGNIKIGDDGKPMIGMNDLEEDLINRRQSFAIEEMRLQREISQLRNKANAEDLYSAKERVSFINQALQKQNELGNKKLKLAQDEFTLEHKKANQGDNNIEDDQALVDREMKIESVQKSIADQSRRMLETQQRINREIGKEVEQRAAAVQKVKEENEAISKQLEQEMDKEMDADLNQEVQITTPKGFFQGFEDRIAELREKQQSALTLDAWKSYQEEIEKTNQHMNDLKSTTEQMPSTNEQIMSVANSFGTLGGAIGGATGQWLSFAANMLKAIPQLITSILALTATETASSATVTAAKGAEAVTKATASGAALPFPLNIAAIAAGVAGVVSALATKPKIPHFATGGAVFGDTIARVGEYNGARYDPEIIQRRSTIEGWLQKSSMNNGMNGEVIFRIEGDTMEGTLVNNRSRNDRMG
ncbi:hypothetical protein K5X82_07405 [Halosquirtibacter xylanolyticus]|uniref:hypothetical protein n=1 Tax=Halosquirtibacter xylanolyticus TaxID=3374599 RepID=UPI00374A5CB6|nr:hypothetical protein K5X82_07405 [Prolixibacteraceae bacterium]